MNDPKIPKRPNEVNKISYRIENILNIIKEERAAIIKFEEMKDKFNKRKWEKYDRRF